MCAFIHFGNLFQGQRIDPSTFPFDVELAQLMPIGVNRTENFDIVVVIHPMKYNFDSTFHRPFECVKRMDGRCRNS